MFRPTRPFKDKVTGYDKEPSLRIGKKVPQNAVNLAYYFNPTATDAEKILAADPPRNTIDHRIETQWLTLLDQASGPNGEEPSKDLFPKYTYFSDAEGYYGRLTRQDDTVKWYPEKHVNQKEASLDITQIVDQKGQEDKVIEYSDANGYKGNLYLDTVSYEVDAVKDASIRKEVDFTINDFELNFYEIFGTYLRQSDLDSGPWTNEPNPIAGEDYCWPARIEITATKLKASDSTQSKNDTNNKIANFVNSLDNKWDGANETFINSEDIVDTTKPVGYLYFDRLEYEPVGYDKEPESSAASAERSIQIDTDDFDWVVNASATSYNNVLPTIAKAKIGGKAIGTKYLADMGQNYSKIDEFISLISSSDSRDASYVEQVLTMAKENGEDIAIWLSDLKFVVNDESIDMVNNQEEIDAVNEKSKCHFVATYSYKTISPSVEGTMKYNITANYHTITLEDGTCSVKRTLISKKSEPTRYKAKCHYSGLVNKNWTDYDGIAFYMGSVTKGNAVGNQNADEDNEILMFPDKDGYLRRIVEGVKTYTDDNNRPIYKIVYKNYYNIEADAIYLTDVFNNGVACFYRHRLKNPIYDYRGPDEYGFYKGDAVSLYTSTMKNLPKGYEHNIKLTVAEYNEEVSYDAYNNPITVNTPKCYYADLYTSFISSSTDTFKAIYNGFNDIDNDNKVLESGIEEEIYNYPFMINGVDYQLQTVEKRARLSKVKILNYTPIEDTRRRITFSWYIVATNKDETKTFVSVTRQSSILNRDYALPCENYMFEGRGMIISPKLNGDALPASPRDICMNDQASYQSESDDYEPVISDTDTDFIYNVKIIALSEYGTINIKCNPDGSGYITAETTLDTGFYNETRSSYTNKLDMDNPYWTDGKYIYRGYKVKCIDSRNIKVKAPRETKLLDSWYPLIQFGHHSRVMDQYGIHTKVCYSMPEYDTQHFSQVYKQPFVDISNEQATIINPHMIKVKCYPIHVIQTVDKQYNLTVYKKIDDELFKLNIRDISFSDGVIILEDAVSENDTIIVNYTYLEENYQYRGYWRDETDFVRIDLNPNIYHTYNNPDYLPSEVSPSKNLFNKVIYFFMKPSVLYEIPSEYNEIIFDPNNETGSQINAIQRNTEQKIIGYEDPEIIGYSYTEEIIPESQLTPEELEEEITPIKVNKEDNSIPSLFTYDFRKKFNGQDVKITYQNLGFRTLLRVGDSSPEYYVAVDEGIHLENTLRNISTSAMSDDLTLHTILQKLNPCVVSVIFRVKNTSNNKINNITLSSGSDIQISQDDTATINTIENDGKTIGVYAISTKVEDSDSNNKYPMIAVFSSEMKFFYAHYDVITTSRDGMQMTEGDAAEYFATGVNVFTNGEMVGIDSALNIRSEEFSLDPGEEKEFQVSFGVYKQTQNDTRLIDSGTPIYGDPKPIYQTIETEEIVPVELTVKLENENCLYHKIDNSEPNDDADIMVGSVYIRQDTSLHSTIITDARTRGGGVLAEMSDALRHELEPESDYYLDIGYYDGEPYQENGVIIVRLDNRLLKENGGRFTVGDIENKVKRWLGFGVYPIIEFVDSYKKQDLPQYTLEIEDSYTNIIDIIPEILLECVAI